MQGTAGLWLCWGFIAVGTLMVIRSFFTDVSEEEYRADPISSGPSSGALLTGGVSFIAAGLGIWLIFL